MPALFRMRLASAAACVCCVGLSAAMLDAIPCTGGGKKGATSESGAHLLHDGSDFAVVHPPRLPTLNVGGFGFATRKGLVALFFRFAGRCFCISTLNMGVGGGHGNGAIAVSSVKVCGAECCTLFSATRYEIDVIALLLWHGLGHCAFELNSIAQLVPET